MTLADAVAAALLALPAAAAEVTLLRVAVVQTFVVASFDFVLEVA